MHKTYINVILEKDGSGCIYKIYMYRLKKNEAVDQELEDCNTLEKEYYNEELYCFNENNKTLVLGHLINDLMKSDIL